jgi:hypothetical protein
VHSSLALSQVRAYRFANSRGGPKKKIYKMSLNSPEQSGSFHSSLYDWYIGTVGHLPQVFEPYDAVFMELTGKKVAAVHCNVSAKKRNSYRLQSNFTVA